MKNTKMQPWFSILFSRQELTAPKGHYNFCRKKRGLFSGVQQKGNVTFFL